MDGLIEIYKMVLASADARRGWGSAPSGGPQLTDQDSIMVKTITISKANKVNVFKRSLT